MKSLGAEHWVGKEAISFWLLALGYTQARLGGWLVKASEDDI
jgi:hypothetical protein